MKRRERRARNITPLRALKLLLGIARFKGFLCPTCNMHPLRHAVDDVESMLREHVEAAIARRRR